MDGEDGWLMAWPLGVQQLLINRNNYGVLLLLDCSDQPYFDAR